MRSLLQNQPLSHIRIIAGKWRSRRVVFNTQTGVRPSPDRVRETLFNWLQPVIKGAHCLDLCAGSGVLGFEALSRGAEHVVMVDNSAAVVKQLHDNAKRLSADKLSIIRQEIPAVLILPARSIDIIFLDPPFKQGKLAELTAWLATVDWLKPDAFIYIESESELTELSVPKNWSVYRQNHTRHVNYSLWQVAG